jgi:hypothetical protein
MVRDGFHKVQAVVSHVPDSLNAIDLSNPQAASQLVPLLKRVHDVLQAVADQTEPVRRRVAIKVIRSGFDSRRLLARFEQERQALALIYQQYYVCIACRCVACAPLKCNLSRERKRKATILTVEITPYLHHGCDCTPRSRVLAPDAITAPWGCRLHSVAS